MRKRRTFTKNFKTEITTKILSGALSKAEVTKQFEISEALLDRWINDHIAQAKSVALPVAERRRDYQSMQELKAKIAELYMKIEKFEKADYASVNRGGASLFI